MDTNIYRIKKTQIVELVAAGAGGAPNTLGQINFTPQTYLANKKILSIEVFTGNDLTTSPLGNVVVPTANMKGCYLTLYTSNPDRDNDFSQWFQQRPLWSFHRVQNGTDPYVKELALIGGNIVSWEKSFVNVFTAGGLANTVNWSFVFDVSYEDA